MPTTEQLKLKGRQTKEEKYREGRKTEAEGERKKNEKKKRKRR